MRIRTYDTVCDADVGRVRRRWASWLGLGLLYLNLLAAAATPPSPHGSVPLFARDLFQSDRIIVCTASGMVVVDSAGRPVDDGRHRTSHDEFCVFCLPLLHSGTDVPALAVVLAPPLLPAGSMVFADHHRIPARPSAFSLQPVRAPPPTA
ncbi:MAG: hypothetical protein F8N37_09500 [Telmatospirillum sp.]|nr:hypothetical protein [Telmatospirillum sp.]